MKLSIKKIFSNISLFMTFALLIATIAVVFTFEQGNSFKKVNILNTQKEIASALHELDKKDLELTLIQFNGKSTQLRYQIEKLYDLNKYDTIGKYILGNSQDYLAQLEKLSMLVSEFNTKAFKYFNSSDNAEIKLKESLDVSLENLNNHISNIIFKNIEYDNEKFKLLQILAISTFFVIFILTFWYQRRLRKIYEDIIFLYSPKSGKITYEVHTIEADAIYIRMSRRPGFTVDQASIDPITGINNNKGLENTYAEKKGMKASSYTALTVLEVDDFSKTNKAFPQDLTQSILKKIAYTISLYEQSADVIARSGYNQFTLIFSRETKEQAFKEVDAIRQSISELKFAVQNQAPIHVTVSGGFYIKQKNVALNRSIDDAKAILKWGKTQNKNKIHQKKDMANLSL